MDYLNPLLTLVILGLGLNLLPLWKSHRKERLEPHRLGIRFLVLSEWLKHRNDCLLVLRLKDKVKV